jgi:hypothetical protein
VFSKYAAAGICSMHSLLLLLTFVIIAVRAYHLLQVRSVASAVFLAHTLKQRLRTPRHGDQYV